MAGVSVDKDAGSADCPEIKVNSADVYEVQKPSSINSNKENGFKDKPLNNDVDFDDLLPQIGNFGKYQIILFLLLAPYTFFYVFVYFTQIFITLIPDDYWCHVPELQHWDPSDR